MGTALSAIFALVACVAILALVSVEMEVDMNQKGWWLPVLVVHVGGFSVIAVLITASLVMLKGWP